MSLERAIRGVLTEQVAPKEITEAKDPNEYDQEGDMMKSQLRQIDSAIDKLMGMVKDDDNLPEWVQSKMTKATDYIRSVRDYLESEKMAEEVELEEAISPKSIEMSMRKALKDRGNYKNGKVNWNFIDADVYMELNPEKAEVRSFYRMFDQIATKLTKELNIKEETDLGEAKDFVFRFATSDAGREYQKMKAQQRRDMNKKNDPGADKKGLAISVHDMDKAKKKAKAKLGRIPSRARYGGSSKYDHNTGKLQYGKPNLPENVELDEGINQKKFAAGAKAMKAYAMKHGGVDKADFMKVADSLARISRINLLQAGQELSRLNRLVDNQDTDVRERIYVELKKVGLVEALEEKTLTPAEKKKREEIAKAIERENPDMPMPQKMAIATAQAKKVAEATVDTADIEKKKRISDSDKDKIAKIADMMRKEKEAQAKKTAEAYDEPQGQAKRMMSPLQKARMDKEKADRDRDGKLKEDISEAKKVSTMQIHKVLAKTKNSREGIVALKKAFKVNDMEAKKMLNQVMNEETIDEISRSMTPMNKKFGKSVDPKKFDMYKKHVKQHGVDEPTVRMIIDNPNNAESKRMMKNKHIAQAVSLRKAAMNEAVKPSQQRAIKQLELARKARAMGDHERAEYHTQLARQLQNEGTFISKFKEELKEKKRAMSETKGAPKGYHFTRSGQLKKGDAGQDGPGGKMLRSDPLDKQRKKIPPLPENDK